MENTTTITTTISEGFEEFLEAVSKLLDEADITMSNTGLRIRAMDSSHVAMPSLEIGKVDTGEVFRANIGLLAKAIGKGLRTVSYDTETKKVTLSDGLRKLVVHTLQPENVEVPEPKVELNVKGVSVDLSQLKMADGLMDLGSVRFTGDGATITARSDGEISAYEAVVGFYEGEKFSVVFNYNYLAPLMGLFKPKAGIVATCDFASAKPLRAEFTKTDGLDSAKLEYWLAPRVTDEDQVAQTQEAETKTEVVESTSAAVSAKVSLGVSRG